MGDRIHRRRQTAEYLENLLIAIAQIDLAQQLVWS
jgi:hypothetical protein